MRWMSGVILALVVVALGANAAEPSAVVHKPKVDLYAQPSFDAPKVATLSRNTVVQISAQQGLWYQGFRPVAHQGTYESTTCASNPLAPTTATQPCEY